MLPLKDCSLCCCGRLFFCLVLTWMFGLSGCWKTLNSITDCSQDLFTSCWLHLLFIQSHSSSVRDGGFACKLVFNIAK